MRNYRKILIQGLPGSGKTTLAKNLQTKLKAGWVNADQVRKKYNDWDFSLDGRLRQAKRLNQLANKILTFISNIFTGLNLTDMETGYKCFTKEAIKNINLIEKSFGFEPEITAKLAKKKLKFFEVGISYQGRTYEEGKKIRPIDGLKALICIIKYNLFS